MKSVLAWCDSVLSYIKEYVYKGIGKDQTLLSYCFSALGESFE